MVRDWEANPAVSANLAELNPSPRTQPVSILLPLFAIVIAFLFSSCTSFSPAPRETTRVIGTSTAAVDEAQKWAQSIEAELPVSHALVRGAYDVSSGQIHVPVTPQLANALETGPRTEVVAFLDKLRTDEAHRGHRDYISKCLEALKGGGKSTKSRWKFPDGREVDVVYYHIPLLAVATDGGPSVAKDQETITLSPFVDTFDWRRYHLTKAAPDSADGHFRLIAVSQSGEVTLRDLTSGERILLRHDQTAKEISSSKRPMRVTGFDSESQSADFEWLTTK
jgi:hypothetical protein